MIIKFSITTFIFLLVQGCSVGDKVTLQRGSTRLDVPKGYISHEEVQLVKYVVRTDADNSILIRLPASMTHEDMGLKGPGDSGVSALVALVDKAEADEIYQAQAEQVSQINSRSGPYERAKVIRDENGGLVMVESENSVISGIVAVKRLPLTALEDIVAVCGVSELAVESICKLRPQIVDGVYYEASVSKRNLQKESEINTVLTKLINSWRVNVTAKS